MGHGLTENDEMMYVGETPWHKKGVKLDKLANAEEAILASKLGWHVSTEPVITAEGRTLVGKFITVRDDTKQPLGVVGGRYEPLQNVDAFKFFDTVTQDPLGPKYVTAGSINGGLQIWILAKLPDFIEVTKEDIVEEFILMTNGFDGWHPVEMFWTPIRVVCQNTLAMSMAGAAQAQSEGRAKGIKFRHIGDWENKVQLAQDALAIARARHDSMSEIIGQLVNYQPSVAEVDAVFKLLVPAGETAHSRTKGDRVRGELINLFENGAGNNLPGVSGTGWAIYNAVTEYTDHVMPLHKSEDADEKRLISNWWGGGMNKKEDALRLLVGVASGKIAIPEPRTETSLDILGPSAPSAN